MSVVVVDADRYSGKRPSVIDVSLGGAFALLLIDLLPRIKLISSSGNDAAIDELSEYLSLAILELCEAI